MTTETADRPPISPEHAKLLRHAELRWIDMETGAPGIDPKRPYGNSDVAGDIHEILTGSRAEDDLSEEQEDRYMELHRGTLGALQAVLDWALGGGDD